MPREHGVDFSLEQGMEVSVAGTNRILDCLKANGVRATFFCTANFAERAPEVMRRIMAEGHEVACHGVDHWRPEATDVERSKQVVERVTGRTAYGYRQPRMFPVSDAEIERMGYRYNSSLNPAFIPGRYMHLSAPRTWFMRGRVMQIPASVTPWVRFPLFWLALHNLPEGLYHALVRRTLRHDGYFVTYFHPWEFYELREHPEFRMPFIIRNNSGAAMAGRLDRLIRMLKAGAGSERKAKVLVMAESRVIENPKPNMKPKKVGFLKMRVIPDLKSSTVSNSVLSGIDCKKSTAITDASKSHSKFAEMFERHISQVVEPEEIGKVLPWVHIAIANAKTTISGTYHGVKAEYLQEYLNEFCYKFNRRYFKEGLFDRLLMVAAENRTQFVHRIYNKNLEINVSKVA